MNMNCAVLMLPLIMLLPGCAHSQKKAGPIEILNEANVENAYPRLSKDGQRILYQSNRTGKWQLYVMDIKSHAQTRLTNDSYNNNFPDWSADNKQVAFVSDRDGNEEVYVMNTDGSNVRRMTNDRERDIHPYFSPDGKYLLFNSTRTNGTLDVFRMELQSGKVEQVVNTTQFEETCARYSHDMKKIVFLRNNASTDDIYVLDVASGTISNITNTPNTEHGWPVFSPDDKWIYYSSRINVDYAIYKQSIVNNELKQVTLPARGKDDARPYISRDNKTLIYNKTTGAGIAIYSLSMS